MSTCVTMHSAKGQNGMVRALRLRRLVNAVMVAEALCIPCFVAGAVLGLVWYGGRRMGMELAVAVGGVRFSGFDVSGVLELAGSPGPHVQPAGCGCVDG